MANYFTAGTFDNPHFLFHAALVGLNITHINLGLPFFRSNHGERHFKSTATQPVGVFSCAYRDPKLSFPFDSKVTRRSITTRD